MSALSPYVLITGGSRGVGLALAKELAGQGHAVLITGRHQKTLEAAADHIEGTVQTFVCDHANLDDQKRLVAFIAEMGASIQLLINNAAIQYTYNFAEKPAQALVDDIAYETTVNFTSVVQLTALCLPLLSPTGVIVNITSGLALTPKRSAPVYCATKAALHSFSQSLRWQLEASPKFQNVTVIEALLPMIDTRMTAGRRTGKLSPEQAARAILQGVKKRQQEINVGKVKLLRFLLRTLPPVAQNLFRKH